MSKALHIGKTEGGKAVNIDLAKLIGTKMLVQGNSGAGKSWLLRLLIEQAAAECQVIVLDPEGEFATLREHVDMLLVGREGEIPTDCKTAAALAHKLIDLRVSAVIDLYDLHPDKRREYVRLFLSAVMAVPKSMYHPILFVIDEAHVFCPERAAGEAESTSAVVTLMSQGRKRGFAGILATQRLSKLHKDAAAETNNVFIGRTWLDNDQARAGDLLGMSKVDRQNLRSLPAGEWWAFGPAITPEGVIDFKAGQVKTTHPQYGEKHKVSAPAASKAILRVVPELEEIARQSPDEVHDIEAAKKRIADLRRQLAQASAAKPAAKVETKTVERWAVKDADVKRIEKASEQFNAAADKMAHLLNGPMERIGKPLSEILTRVKAINAAPMVATSPATLSRAVMADRPAIPKTIPLYRPHREPSGNGDASELDRGARRMLGAIAQREDGADATQLSVLTGYRKTSRGEFLRQLKSAGLITSGPIFKATAEGMAVLGSDYEPLPTGAALRRHWSEKLTGGEKAIFDMAVNAYPDSVDAETIEAETGYKKTSRGEFCRLLAARKVIVSKRGTITASEKLFE